MRVVGPSPNSGSPTTRSAKRSAQVVAQAFGSANTVLLRLAINEGYQTRLRVEFRRERATCTTGLFFAGQESGWRTLMLASTLGFDSLHRSHDFTLPSCSRCFLDLAESPARSVRQVLQGLANKVYADYWQSEAIDEWRSAIELARCVVVMGK
jgi:hypothetical protein